MKVKKCFKMKPVYKMSSSNIFSLLCFISVLAPANLSTKNTNCKTRANLTTHPETEELGMGRGPGIFSNVPKFTRPFRIISKPAASPNRIPEDESDLDPQKHDPQVTPILGPIPENLAVSLSSTDVIKTTDTEVVPVAAILTAPISSAFDVIKKIDTEVVPIVGNLTVPISSASDVIKTIDTEVVPIAGNLTAPTSSASDVIKATDVYSEGVFAASLTVLENRTSDLLKSTEAPSVSVPIAPNLTLPVSSAFDLIRNITTTPSKGVLAPENLTVPMSSASDRIESKPDVRLEGIQIDANLTVPAHLTVPARFTSDFIKSATDAETGYQIASSESVYVPANWTALSNLTIPANFVSIKSTTDARDEQHVDTAEGVYMASNLSVPANFTFNPIESVTVLKGDLQVASSESAYPSNLTAPTNFTFDSIEGSTDMKTNLTHSESVYVPANLTINANLISDLIKTTTDATTFRSILEGEEPGTGRDPGLFDLFPKFTRPFRIISKPSTKPNRTQNSGQKDDQQVAALGTGVQIPANLTLQLPVSVGGTTTSESGLATQDYQVTPTTTEEGSLLGQIKYPCACDGGTCGCCTGRILSNFNINFQQRGCVNVTYHNEDFEFHVRMLWNDRVFYQRRMSGKNPPPLCIPLPRVVNLKFCVKFSNIYMIGRNMHMCLDIEGLLVEYPVFAFSFECFRLGSNGFAVVSPEDGGGLGPPPEEDPYIPKPKPTKPPKPPKPQSGNKPKPQTGNKPSAQAGNKPSAQAGSKPGGNKPKPGSTTTEDYDAIVASEGDEIDSAKSVIRL